MQEDGVWRTINGAKVFIKNGQSVMDAFVRQKAYKEEQPTQEEIDKKIDDNVDSGNVFDFGVGPKNTFIAFKRNGMRSFSEWDAPITLATKEGILQQLDVGQEAAAKVWDDQANVRSNYFKRNGYEVIGKKQEAGSPIVYLLVRRKK